MRTYALNFVVGCQYGSEGKGKISGYLARKYDVDFSICSFSSQAGHTFYDSEGEKYLVQQVPMAVVNPNTFLLISQGAIIDLDILRSEISRFNLSPLRLMIHPKAIVIDQRHKDFECEIANGPKRIASTCKGNGAAMAEFVARNKELKTMDMIEEFADYIGDTSSVINRAIGSGAMCMAECAQGFSLDIYQGFYPHVTSRGCTVSAELARIGVSHNAVGDVYGVFRTYPIRVGNIVEDDVTVGYSGGCYSDQHETTWDHITEASGAKERLLERTTVTNRVRRVFTFSAEQAATASRVNGVTHGCFTFADYIDANIYGKCNTDNKAYCNVREWLYNTVNAINRVSGWYKYMHGGDVARSALIGTGPYDFHIIDVDIDNCKINKDRITDDITTKYRNKTIKKIEVNLGINVDDVYDQMMSNPGRIEILREKIKQETKQEKEKI